MPMEEVLFSFPFLEGVKHWAGEVQVLKVEEGRDQTRIYLRMRIGSRWIRLPRSSLLAITDALQKAKSAADEEYKKLLKRMNP